MKIALNIIKILIVLIIGLPGYILFSLVGDLLGGLIMLIGAIAASIVLTSCGHWMIAVVPIIAWMIMMNAAYELAVPGGWNRLWR